MNVTYWLGIVATVFVALVFLTLLIWLIVESSLSGGEDPADFHQTHFGDFQ